MNGSRQRGFTVIELLVTIAVLTIIISMGVPMYGQFTRGSAMSGTTSDFISSVNIARSEAVSQREAVTLQSISGEWTNGWNIVRDRDGVQLRTSDQRSSSLAVSVVEANDVQSLTFDREGRVSSGGAFVDATFTLCPNDGAPGPGRTVTVSRFGRVQLTQLACP